MVKYCTAKDVDAMKPGVRDPTQPDKDLTGRGIFEPEGIDPTSKPG